MISLKRVIRALLIVMSAALIFCGDNEGNQSGQQSTDTAAPNLANLLPADNEVSGWSKLSEPRFFGQGNLWEYINGGADAYLMYGFQMVITADYSHEASGNEVIIDVYEHKDPVHAFGIYANERNPEYTFEKIGVQGYVGGTSLNYWKGKYYIKITAFDDDTKIQQEMRKLAALIDSKIESTAGEPVELSYLPQKNQIQYSAKFVPQDILGQSYLFYGFEAEYRENSKEYKVIFIQLSNDDEASNALDRYKTFIGNSGSVKKDVSAPGDGGFVGKDSFYGDMMAVRSGKYLAIILSMVSETKGKAALEEVLNNIQ